jgi:hypothetical protein
MADSSPQAESRRPGSSKGDMGNLHIYIYTHIYIYIYIYCMPFGIPPTLPIVVWLGVRCFLVFAGWVWMPVGYDFEVIWRSRVIFGGILVGF